MKHKKNKKKTVISRREAAKDLMSSPRAELAPSSSLQYLKNKLENQIVFGNETGRNRLKSLIKNCSWRQSNNEELHFPSRSDDWLAVSDSKLVLKREDSNLPCSPMTVTQSTFSIQIKTRCDAALRLS